MPLLMRASACCGTRAKTCAEFGERFRRAAEAQERVGVIGENVDVVGRQRARLVETVERFLVALERMQHLAEIDPAPAARAD